MSTDPQSSAAGHAPASAAVESLPGVGPAAGRKLRQHGLATLADLLWLLPSGYDDLRCPIGVAEAVELAAARPRVCVRAVVRSAGFVPMRGRRAVRVSLADEDADRAGLTAWWFFAAHGILAVARPEQRLLVIGRLAPARRGSGAVMAHPELLRDDGQAPVRPRYPKLPGVSAERLRSLIAAALERVGCVPDPVPPRVADREQLARSGQGFRDVHLPEKPPRDAATHPIRERLAWAESFASSWLRTRREHEYGQDALPLPPQPQIIEQLQAALGFDWTPGQARSIGEIAGDLARSRPMRRLLSGDVGSGKTAVALAAAAQAVASGAQAAILAPTTPLADQYAAAAQPLVQATGARVALLTGATPSRERTQTQDAAARGDIDVLIGTHVLLSSQLEFRQLALVVVDEQQRLGVAQRLALSRRRAGGIAPHLLTLSATPIPRTLALALRGELSTSELDDLPPGRKPVSTRAVSRPGWNAEVLPAIRAALEADENVFVVCPRIGDDEDEEAAGPAAEERLRELSAALGKRQVVLAHGRLGPAALADALGRFRSGESPVLVGTTVIEVGLDVPRATLMVVDGAESFGLAQLHQLRGRVGRSARGGSCLLVHDEPLVEPARSRLRALERLSRGADVARADLELRGPGDFGGTRQSGDSGLVYLDAFADAPWLGRIPSDVEQLRDEDPALSKPEHALLRLFVDRLPERPEARAEAG